MGQKGVRDCIGRVWHYSIPEILVYLITGAMLDGRVHQPAIFRRTLSDRNVGTLRTAGVARLPIIDIWRIHSYVSDIL